MYQLLQSLLLEPYASTMLWTHQLLKDWTKRPAYRMNEMSKNNILFSIHPYT